MNFDKVEQFSGNIVAYARGGVAEVDVDREKAVYAQVVKLGEEVGELNEAVLAHYNKQRQSKSGKGYDLEGEIADVILATFVLAEHLNIKVTPALSAKMAKINARLT